MTEVVVPVLKYRTVGSDPVNVGVSGTDTENRVRWAGGVFAKVTFLVHSR